MQTQTQSMHKACIQTAKQIVVFFSSPGNSFHKTLPASEIRQVNKSETWAELCCATQKSHSPCFNRFLCFQCMYTYTTKASGNAAILSGEHVSFRTYTSIHTLITMEGMLCKNQVEDTCWEPEKMWQHQIRKGKNNRMKSQDACWSGAWL